MSANIGDRDGLTTISRRTSNSDDVSPSSMIASFPAASARSHGGCASIFGVDVGNGTSGRHGLLGSGSATHEDGLPSTASENGLDG